MAEGNFFTRLFPYFIIFTLFVTGLQAQTFTSGVTSDGRDFYIGSVFPSFNKVGNPSAGRETWPFYKMYALICAYQDCKVYLSYFDAKTGVESQAQTFSVSPRTVLQIALDSAKMHLTEPGDIAEFRSCHITSDAPVNVQYFSTGACSGGSYLALPTNALGKNYVIASYNDNPGAGAATNSGSIGEDASGFFEIIAPFDSTNITITPNGLTAGGHWGTNTGAHSTGYPWPYTVMLHRGECYWVKGDGDHDNDISGSIVTSDKPVAVLAGHEDAFIGDVGARYLDARDFMIEEMIPAEWWDSTGYVSMPLKDPQGVQPEEAGFGENYRVYTNNPSIAKIELSIAGFDGDYDMWTQKFDSRQPEKDNIGAPTSFRAINGKKFGVMMYDNRGQGNLPPFSAESMMSIIPMSRWKRSFMVYVPFNGFLTLQNYYVNILALRSDIDKDFIRYSFNDTVLRPLSALTARGSYTNIPGHPELKGSRYAVIPGIYYFVNTRDAIAHPLKEVDTSALYRATPAEVAADTSVLHGAFMVYNYGFRALDPDRDLGDFDGDDFFFSYANPAGASLSNGDTGKFSVTIDSFCGRWHVCVQDNRVNDPGLRSIALLHDSTGEQFSVAKQSMNCRLDPSFDKNSSGDVEFPGTANSACFDVLVNSPIDSSYAAILVTDNAGNLKVIELRYAPIHLSVSPSATNVSFSTVRIGSDTCITISIVNHSKAAQTVLSETMDTTGGLSLTAVVPALPVQLKPGDSLTFNVCYAPNKNTLIADTLRIAFDCLTIPIRISGKGGTGLISAEDMNFGAIDTGMTSSRVIGIMNIGTWGFLLTNNWTISGSSSFTVMPPTLPTLLGPTADIPVTVTYTPHTVGKDTAIIHWTTDIGAPYTQSVKSFSILTGEGIVTVNSVDELHKAPSISIRPNPASGSSIILTLSSEETSAEIRIFDLLGQEMYKNTIAPEVKNAQLEIPIGNLQNGIYYVRVTMSGKTVTEKFEIIR